MTAEGREGEERSLIALAIDRPVATTMIVVAALVFGFVSLDHLGVTLLPRVSYPSLTVRTEYEGSAPSEVEELVTRPLEDNLSVISNLNGYRSISRAGVSDLILEFEWDTDMSFAAQDVREKVDQVRPFLPQEIKKPLLLKYDPTLDPIMRLGLFGQDDLTRTRFYAEERLKKQLESISGVAAVRVRGGYESEIRVDLDEAALRETRLTVDVIRQRLQEENVNLASGLLREGDREFVVRTLNEFRSVQEIRELIVETRGDRLIRLSDLARVHRTDKEPDVITRIDGRPSVEIAIFKENSSNIVEVAHSVKSVLFGPNWRKTVVGGIYREDLEPEDKKVESSFEDGDRGGDSTAALRLVKSLPAGLGLRLLSDQSTFIESSISEVRRTGIYGALFAVIVLLIFLRSMRSTLIIAVSIPVSIIATFGPMMQFGVSLNVMSLGGLALGIGMLVDASIVVLESIDRCQREGDPLRRAALRGTREVASAVVASVLTTVAVFFPIVFVEGIAGEIFKDQSLTVVFSLLASLAVALFLIPMLSGRSVLLWIGGFFVLSPNEGQGSRITQSFRGLGQALRSTVTGWASLRSAVNSMRKIPGKGLVKGILIALFGVVWLPFHLLFLGLEIGGRLLWAAAILILFLVTFPLALLFGLLRLVFRPFGWLFDRGYAVVEKGYALLLTGALHTRLVVLGLAAGLSYLAVQEVDKIGLDLIPEMHSGEIIIELPQPVGTSLSATSEIARRAEARLRSMAAEEGLKIDSYSTLVGVARDEIAPPGEGPHTAKVHVSLPLVADMAQAEALAIGRIRDAFADIAEIGRLEFSAPRLITFANPLEIQIKGEQLDRIESLGRLLAERLAEAQFLEDIQTTIQDGSPEFVIRYDRVRLAERGVTLAKAAGTLRDKIKGTIPTRYSVSDEGRKIDVLVKIPENAISSVEELSAIEVAGNPDNPVVLSEVAQVSQGRGPSEVRHIGGERAVILTASPIELDLDSATRRIEKELTALRRDRPTLFEGVAVKVAGQSAEAERSSQQLLFALALALVLVYIVMASQFESLLDPLIIMFSSVFAGVGAVFALSWLGIAASVVVFIGGIMLAGIVVNNAIVLIDCINRLRREGMETRQAIIHAGSIRLRPILMTTATTVLGLMPMALSTGEGAELRVPMAVTVMSGLLSSTVLTLVIIPVLYSVVHQGVDWISRSSRGDAA